jgi:hypothetical protein
MANEDDRNLPARTGDSRRSVKLHDNGLRAGNLIETAIARLDENQIKALGEKAAEAALDLQKRQTQQNIDYVTGKKVVEDHIDTWDALNKHGHTTRQSVTTDVETGAGRMRIESKSGATCFVATAAYGDWQHPEVEFLRWHRDNVLVRSAAGRVFIRAYWHIGPQLAKVVAPFPLVRGLTRGILSSLVAILRARQRRR